MRLHTHLLLSTSLMLFLMTTSPFAGDSMDIPLSEAPSFQLPALDLAQGESAPGAPKKRELNPTDASEEEEAPLSKLARGEEGSHEVDALNFSDLPTEVQELIASYAGHPLNKRAFEFTSGSLRNVVRSLQWIALPEGDDEKLKEWLTSFSTYQTLISEFKRRNAHTKNTRDILTRFIDSYFKDTSHDQRLFTLEKVVHEDATPETAQRILKLNPALQADEMNEEDMATMLEQWKPYGIAIFLSNLLNPLYTIEDKKTVEGQDTPDILTRYGINQFILSPLLIGKASEALEKEIDLFPDLTAIRTELRSQELWKAHEIGDDLYIYGQTTLPSSPSSLSQFSHKNREVLKYLYSQHNKAQTLDLKNAPLKFARKLYKVKLNKLHHKILQCRESSAYWAEGLSLIEEWAKIKIDLRNVYEMMGNSYMEPNPSPSSAGLLLRDYPKALKFILEKPAYKNIKTVGDYFLAAAKNAQDKATQGELYKKAGKFLQQMKGSENIEKAADAFWNAALFAEDGAKQSQLYEKSGNLYRSLERPVNIQNAAAAFFNAAGWAEDKAKQSQLYEKSGNLYERLEGPENIENAADAFWKAADSASDEAKQSQLYEKSGNLYRSLEGPVNIQNAAAAFWNAVLFAEESTRKSELSEKAGNLYESLGNIKKAANAFWKAADSASDEAKQSQLFEKSGTLYERLEGSENIEKAADAFWDAAVCAEDGAKQKKFFEKAGNLYESLGNIKKAANAFWNAADCAEDKAKQSQLFEKAGTLYERLEGSENIEKAADAFFNAAVFAEDGAKQKKFFEKAGNLYESVGGPDNPSNAAEAFAKAADYTEDKVKQTELYEKSGTLYESVGGPDNIKNAADAFAKAVDFA